MICESQIVKQKLESAFRSVVSESFGPILPILLIGAFFINGLYAMVDLAPTQDEGLHLAGGLSYWERADYRLHPENGNLPQRLIVLPARIGGETFPEAFEPRFRIGDQAWLGTAILFDSGGHGLWWLHLGRSAVLLVGCALCWMVYRAARGLWGPAGGLFSLWMCAWSPTILAHATLATSDLTFTAAAVLFLVAFCRYLRSLRLGWAILAGAAAGLAAVSKYAVVAMIPVALALLVWRAVGVPGGAGAGPGADSNPGSRVRWTCVGACCIGLAGWIVVWAFYGFRFGIFHPDYARGARTMVDTATLLNTCGGVCASVALLLKFKLFPEAFLHGLAFAVAFSQERQAFFLGELRFGGWRAFFPVLFLFKSTLPLLVCTAILGAFGVRGILDRKLWHHRMDWVRRNPLFAGVVLALVAYSLMAVFSNLNIGHRHILPVYAFLFILCGAVVARIRISPRPVLLGSVVILLAAVQLGTAVLNHGRYLGYFNPLIGPQSNARFVAVDSSLDWGQDLNRYSRWLDRVRSTEPEAPVFHMLFTPAELSAYGIYDGVLFAFGGRNTPDRLDLTRLEPGYYAISATLLMGLYNIIPRPWTPAHSAELETLRNAVSAAGKGMDGSRGSLQRNLAAVRPDVDPPTVIDRFVRLQFERLRLHLRNLDPVEMVGDGILIFRLADADLEEAGMTGFTGFEGGIR